MYKFAHGAMICDVHTVDATKQNETINDHTINKKSNTEYKLWKKRTFAMDNEAEWGAGWGQRRW